MAFTTLAEVKRALRIPSAITDHDDLLTELIEGVGSTILADIGGGLTSALLTTYTQTYDVNRDGMRELKLPKFPLGAVSEVRYGVQGGDAGTALSTYSYYATPEGIVRLVEGAGDPTLNYWPVGRQNVRVTFTAGFANTTTKDYKSLALAEKLTVCEMFNTIGGAGRKSEKIGNYSYTNGGASDRGDDLYPTVAAAIINKYRAYTPFDPVIP